MRLWVVVGVGGSDVGGGAAVLLCVFDLRLSSSVG